MSEEVKSNKYSYLRNRVKKVRSGSRFSSRLKQISRLETEESSTVSKAVRPSPTQVLRTSDIIKHYKTLDLDKYVKFKNKGFFEKARELLYDPNNEVMFAIISHLNYNKMVSEIESSYEY